MKTEARKYHEIVNVGKPGTRPEPTQWADCRDGTGNASIKKFSDGSVYICCNIADIFYTRQGFIREKSQTGLLDDIDCTVAKWYNMDKQSPTLTRVITEYEYEEEIE